MAAEEHADARHTRSSETKSQRPTQLHQRRTQKEERRTATLRLPMITLQVQVPRMRMPRVNMPDMGEVVNTVKSRMPSPAEAAYFTSENEARTGESSQEFTGPEQEFAQVYGDMTYTDARNPILT